MADQDLDDMHCAICKTNVFSEETESYMVYKWDTLEQRNVFYAIYCKRDRPVR